MNPANQIGGTTVIINNLLSYFDPDSFSVGYLNYAKILPQRENTYKNSYRLIPNYHLIQFAGIINDEFRINFAVKRAVKIIRSKNIKYIIGVYPTYKSLRIAYEVSKICKVKFIPYLHDMISETLSHTKLGEKSKLLEEQIFNSSHKILTMSDGVSEFFKKKWKKNTYPLEHSYPEKINNNINLNRTNTLFWGGAIQNFNVKGFRRIFNACNSLGSHLEVTNLQSVSGMGLSAKLVNNFYPRREDYIIALTKKGVLTLAVDWI